VGSLRLVSSLDELVRAPIGRALAGSSFLAWCHGPRLVGTVHFGQRTESDARLLARLYELATHPALRPPLRRVVDGRALAGIDEDAWDHLTRTVVPRIDGLRGLFERQAVIVAPGLRGARTAALLAALGPGDVFRPFIDAEEGYRWADPVDGDAARAAVEEILTRREGLRVIQGRVRAWIGANLAEATAPACARALGLSTRSLQRELAAAGASFREMVVEARIRAACALLVETDTKVELVARAVGCSSSSQLSVLLRRAGLPTPAALRAERRR
jgi:AraC-like DNA-binding protein